MRVFSWFMYLVSCGCAISSAFFEFFAIDGKKQPFYSQTMGLQGILGYVYLAVAVIGILMLLINKKGFVFAAGFAEVCIAAFRYGDIIFGMSLEGAGQNRAENAWNMKNSVEPVITYFNGFYMMVAAAACMFIFGLFYFMSAKDNYGY